MKRMEFIGAVKIGGPPAIKQTQKYWEYYVTPEGEIYRFRTDKLDEAILVNCSVMSNNSYKGKKYGGYIGVPTNKLPEKYVHRIVAKAFVPNDDPLNKTHVDHIDGNKHNNHYTNLQWVTRSENMKRMHKQRREAGKTWHGRAGGE